MKKIISSLIVLLFLGMIFNFFPSGEGNKYSEVPFIKINLPPSSIVYEGDIIPCKIIGEVESKYWCINDGEKHYSFEGNNPLIFNPEPTPLNENYVTLTIYVENSLGVSSDSVKIKLYKLYFGDLHWHTVYEDGDYDIDTMYQNAIKDNYLDFTACSEHGLITNERSSRSFPVINNLIIRLLSRFNFKFLKNLQLVKDPWDDLKDKAIKYYEPGEFTTFLGFEWSASNLYAGGYKFSENGCEDVSHINFYYRDVYSTANAYSPKDKLTYDEIFEAMAEENSKGHKNIGFPHHPQGKIYIFSSSLIDNPDLINFTFLQKFAYDFTTNFTFLANIVKNNVARDQIIRGAEIYSRWGLAIGKYSGIPMTWPYYEDDPLNAVVCANKPEAWAENAMWEWSQNSLKDKRFALQMGSDAHHTDRPGDAFLWRDKPAGIMATYAVHNTREEIFDALDECSFYGSQLLKIRANIRLNDQMALGRWITCSSPLTINISAMSTFEGLDSSGKTMCPHLYNPSALDNPITDVWLVKKDTEKGQPWCKVIEHVRPNKNSIFYSFEDSNVKPNDFYYVAIRQKGQELLPGQDLFTAIIGPVFIDKVI